MKVDTLIHSAGQLLTLAGGPQRGHDLGRLQMLEAIVEHDHWAEFA
jgi:hypothetical protein